MPGVSPGQPESIADFRRLARRLDGGEIEGADLSAVVSGLPTLTETQLDTLAQEAQAQAHINPGLGWAIARVAEETTVAQRADLFIQAKAAWYLGQAANNYARPRRAAAALQRAKAGFELLNDKTWLAACDWQRHALPWAQPDLRRSEAEVRAALTLFSAPQSPLSDYQHECRLTLAYIQILLGRAEEALDNLEICEQIFKEYEDQFNLLRCWMIRANALRRQTAFDEAIVQLESCIKLGEAIHAPVELALSKALLGYVLHKRENSQGEFRKAEAAFLEAVSYFQTLDLPFWKAYSLGGLSLIYIDSGRLSEAADGLAYCRQVYQEYEVDAPLSDALIDSGWLETYRANYRQGLEYLAQAEKLCQRIGNKFMLGSCHMHLGEIYLGMGRYQQSLHYIELAVESFQELKSYGRLAECGLRLARCWIHFGRPDLAFEALQRVEEDAKKAEQGNIFPYLYIRRAETLFISDKRTEASEALQTALIVANQHEDKTGAALAQRLLSEVLCGMGRLAEAAENLEAAESAFNEIGLVIEQAACQIVWGQYYEAVGNVEAAQRALRQAAKVGKDLAPDIVWQAEAGLAALAAASGDFSSALQHYRQFVRALVQMRRDIWQPALAGYFLKRPSQGLNQAVRLAVKEGSLNDILNFIEASKAQTMATLFERPLSRDPIQDLPEIANLTADIRWRQERIRALSVGKNWLQTADLRKMRRELQEMVRQFDVMSGRMERKRQSSPHELLPGDNEFDLDVFIETAIKLYGENWLALDYYLLENQLICVSITSQSCDFVVSDVTGPVRMVFAGLDMAQSSGRWQKNALETLGEWLLPDSLLDKLTPETILLIAPHQQLHYLPWSALWVEKRPLIDYCVPVVVPSLQSSMILMARSSKNLALDKGLLLSVSDFQSRHDPLPQTMNEVEALSQLYPKSSLLVNETATWAALLALAEAGGLADYSFLHIASHAFTDRISGRLSGLAMYDKDVWLDELWDCAPLPRLVTLSACSGSMSRLYEGDEQVGLATTCLAAGVQNVVASLWPVLDIEAAGLMKTFYSYLMLYSNAAKALAMTQRMAAQTGKDMAHWAGFRCTGLPDWQVKSS